MCSPVLVVFGVCDVFVEQGDVYERQDEDQQNGDAVCAPVTHHNHTTCTPYMHDVTSIVCVHDHATT